MQKNKLALVLPKGVSVFFPEFGSLGRKGGGWEEEVRELERRSQRIEMQFQKVGQFRRVGSLAMTGGGRKVQK